MAKTVYGEILSLPSIKGLWRFNNDANDDSGNGNNGVASNVTFNLKDFIYNADFNGVNSKIEVTSNSDLRPTGNFSIGLFFRSTLFIDGSQFFRTGAYAEGGVRLRFFNTSPNTLSCEIIDSTNTYYSSCTISTSRVNFFDGRRHFVVITFQTGATNTLRLYCDGVKSTSSGINPANNQPSYGGTPKFSFGTALTSGGSITEPWDGELEEAFLLNGYVLSDGEIRRLLAQSRGMLL